MYRLQSAILPLSPFISQGNMILQVAFKKTLPDYKKIYSPQKEVQGFVDINTTNSRKWLISNVDRLTAVAFHDGAKWLFFFSSRELK